ncbi:hypothetical protein CRENBAI_002977 [Crenichthys baileyi]|uniref:Beta/gamma crystallin 'Greek key' domain-containing protein n=1 Tax=Crenichthys baileyi TaxID=28760 RepID=A0AAV9R1V7_9TELE
MESFQQTANLDIDHRPGENPARGLQGINPLWESGTQNSDCVLRESEFPRKVLQLQGDSADLFSFISRCNSVKVQGGWWVLYECSNFSGYQYIIGSGEYIDYGQWMGFNDSIRSCKIIRKK